MEVVDLKILTRSLTSNLVQKIHHSNFHQDFTSQLNLHFNNSEDKDQNEQDISEDSLAFSLKTIKYFPHIKGKRYSAEQLLELEELLEKHPSDHSSIRKATNIPKSSFIRLKNELASSITTLNRKIRKSVNYSNLKNEEKYVISKLVHPPSSPKSIKCI